MARITGSNKFLVVIVLTGLFLWSAVIIVTIAASFIAPPASMQHRRQILVQSPALSPINLRRAETEPYVLTGKGPWIA